MIEDEEVKIAENPTEALWENARKAAEERIKSLENGLIIEKAFLGLCESKINKSSVV